jgi:hypothetical protein
MFVHPVSKAGDADVERRNKWLQKAQHKQTLISKHKVKKDQETKDQAYLAHLERQRQIAEKRNSMDTSEELLYELLHRRGQKQLNNPEEEQPIHRAVQAMTTHVENGQIALGALQQSMALMPPTEEVVEVVKNEKTSTTPNQGFTKNPGLTKTQQHTKNQWKSEKMRSRKNKLTKLLVSFMSLYVVMLCLACLAILSWWSFVKPDGEEDTPQYHAEHPPLHHSILF